ncbi:MATH and LRR domain-containing protein PFE0570w-like [Teleopsis dalmanni]|uniref:MATH and LRR domain-containing protein PFE0570w-like n=1 Tax=Teleopsis dalmanni TaxID=139649 RepID=UPI0018CE010A|nr:MATH and LRR domain-containing protein PFE0570w-like [Teleopsis dalmanni]
MQRLTHVQKIASQFGRTCCHKFLTSRLLSSGTCGNHYSTNRLQNLIQQQEQKFTIPAEFNLAASSNKQYGGNSFRKCAPSTQCIFVPDIATEWYKNHRRDTRSEFIARYCEMLKMSGYQTKNTGCKNQSTVISDNLMTRFKRISQDFHKLLVEHERKASVIPKPTPKAPPIAKHKSQNTVNRRRKSRTSENRKEFPEANLKQTMGVRAHGFRFKDFVKEINTNDDDICQDMDTQTNEEENGPPDTSTPNGISKRTSKKKSKTCISDERIYSNVSAHGYSNYPKMFKRQSGGSNTQVKKKYNSIGGRCPDKSTEQKTQVAAHGYSNYVNKPETTREHYGQLKESKISKRSKGNFSPYAHGYDYKNDDTEETCDNNHNHKQTNQQKPKAHANHSSVNQNEQQTPKSCRKPIKTVSAHGYHNPTPRPVSDIKADKNLNSKREIYVSKNTNNVSSNATKPVTLKKKRRKGRDTNSLNSCQCITETTSAESIKQPVTSRRKKRKPEQKHLQEIWIKPNATEMRSTDSGVSLKRYHTQLYDNQCDSSCCGGDECVCQISKANKQYKNANSSTDYPFTSSSNLSPRKRKNKDTNRTNKKKFQKTKQDFPESSEPNKTHLNVQIESSENLLKCAGPFTKLFARRKKDPEPQTDSESNIDYGKEKEIEMEMEKSCSDLEPPHISQYYHHLSHRIMNAKNEDKNVVPKTTRNREIESDYDSDDSKGSKCEVKDKNHYHMLSHNKQCHDEATSRKENYTKEYKDPSVSYYYHDISHCKNEIHHDNKKPKKIEKRRNNSNSDESLDKHYYHNLSHKSADCKKTFANKKLTRKTAGRETSEEPDSDSAASSFDIPKTWNTNKRPQKKMQSEDKNLCTKNKPPGKDVPTYYSNLAKNTKTCKECYDHSRFWKKETPKTDTNLVKAHGYNNDVTVTVRKRCATTKPEYILGRDDSYEKQKRQRKRS